jgi:uncharacterized membrane protein
MRFTRLASALAGSLLGTITIAGSGQITFDYAEIIVPGAVLTNPQGINARGDVVGIYRDAAAKVRGFLWQEGQVTVIEYPDALLTEARGISPSGEIVGTYRMPGEPTVNVHGFLRNNDGTFGRIDYPGHTNTIPQRILPDGTILGCRHDHDLMETMRGIVMRPDGTVSETDAFGSMHNGATPNGKKVVGLFMNMMTNRTESYVIANGELTEFVVPGSNLTSAWDMNPRGEIAGVFRDASNRIHGFVRNGDHYVSIDMPGATTTRVFGINAGGDVVGHFVDTTGRTRGFIARRIDEP